MNYQNHGSFLCPNCWGNVENYMCGKCGQKFPCFRADEEKNKSKRERKVSVIPSKHLENKKNKEVRQMNKALIVVVLVGLTSGCVSKRELKIREQTQFLYGKVEGYSKCLNSYNQKMRNLEHRTNKLEEHFNDRIPQQ